MLHPSLTEIFNLDLKIKALTGIWRLNEINFSSQDIIQYEQCHLVLRRIHVLWKDFLQNWEIKLSNTMLSLLKYFRSFALDQGLVSCHRTCTSSVLCLPGLAAPTSSGHSPNCSLPHVILKNIPRKCWAGKLYCTAMCHLHTTACQKTWGNVQKSEPLCGWEYGKPLKL